MTDEILLMKRLSEGDPKAFAVIFSQYYKGLVLYCNSFIPDIDECEDIVQNMFVELWENRSHLKVNSLQSFLLRCVRHDCLDAIKHHKIVENYSSRFVQSVSPYIGSDDNYLLYNELEQIVTGILDRLEPKSVAAFKMSRWDGKKYDEIAKLTNVSRRTVEVRVTRVVKQLREQLRKYFPNI